ncbi:hypothetical protein [Psychroserpens ponticola]|uniref:Group-specific protein n=1 Tax=Psychroserpens ponticola TaxID=2932268 RepID=A0ABY7RX64_9FLAO|nr:hypothetical protein [Psychroserpens ponticola]WCO01704.1 hypothetical protein MUN68_016785 [Psychroserpens ponticola]
MNYLIYGSGWESFIVIMVLFGVIVPLILFLIGLIQIGKNKKKGQLILIIATIYSIISFGVCGGFGF